MPKRSRKTNGGVCRERDHHGKQCRRRSESPIHAVHDPGCPYPEREHHLYAPKARKRWNGALHRTTLFLSELDRDFLLTHGGITDGVRRLIARERITEQRIAEALADYQPPPNEDLVI